MYENVSGISVKGAMFSTDTTFSFYQKNSERIAIIYGKNGSGKSTISRAFSCYKSTGGIPNLEAQLIDFSSASIVATEPHQSNIFVFNEDYVQQNVRLQQNGLDTIVMFGKQVDLDDKIAKAQKDLTDAIDVQDKQEAVCQKYEDTTSVTSPQYHMNQIKGLLQGDQSWAGIDSKIKGNRQNSSVTDAIIEEIVNISPTRSKDEIQSDFDYQMELFKKISGGAARIQHKVDTITYEVDEDKIVNILAEKIEEPVLSEREQQILSLVVGGHQSFFEEIQEQFSNPDIHTCPYCLQPVSDVYRLALIDSIQKVLNKTVEEHKTKIKKSKLQIVTFDMSPYNLLDSSQVARCATTISELNSIIEQYNALLEQKSMNVYTPIKCKQLGMSEKLATVNLELKALEKLRTSYNNSIDQKSKIRTSLLRMNKELAFFNVQEHNKQYQLLKKVEKEEKKKLKAFIEIKKASEKYLDDLIQQKKSIKIAVDYINKGLQYVLFSTNRLQIHVVDNTYSLLSNGLPVKPSNISSGERNIIALCYFFTQIMNNLNEADMYSKECLLVIDDPVSSFDLENRVGILSYLKSQLLRALLGNNLSKVIIMSHDLGSVYDLQKAIDEIRKSVEKKYGSSTTEFHLWELKNKALCAFSYRNRNEYSLLLETVFQFASRNSTGDDLIIGNVMRRALEAFSTFEYKKGIEEISCDQNILAILGNQKYSDYFENLMYRLVLNGESHSEERVRNLQDPYFFSTITPDEKVRTAKDILCLIRLLNGKHMESHLRGIPNSIPTIDGWCQDILNSH